MAQVEIWHRSREEGKSVILALLFREKEECLFRLINRLSTFPEPRKINGPANRKTIVVITKRRSFGFAVALTAKGRI